MPEKNHGAERPSDHHVDVSADAAAIAAAWQRELPDVPTESIGVLTPLWQAAKLFDDERRRTLRRLDIDPGTLDLLSTLRRAGHPYTLTTRELADACLVTAGAISQRVSRAESDGYVQRATPPGGTRKVTVTLTKSAHQLLNTAVRELLQHEQNLLAAVPPAKQRQLSELLTGLIGLMRQRGQS